MMEPSPLLSVAELKVEFVTKLGTVKAVNGISFGVSEGEIVGLVGETGCGKSATARAMIGLLRRPGRVVHGTIEFDGAKVLSLPPKALRRIRGPGLGFVPQNPFGSLNGTLRIERQFRNVFRAHGDASRAEIRSASIKTLDDVGIPDPERILRGYAHELSGGMAQRVVIALALSLNPKLLIADEPTTGLDLTIQRQILDLLHQLVTVQGRSMLLVSHDLGVVAQYCSRVLVMYAGVIVESGPVREVLKTPAHPYTRALLAAVPRRGKSLRGLPGSVPDPIDYPVGCPFYDRCEFRADPRCATQAPPLRKIGPDHWVASFYDLPDLV
jgi:peptide/nickel transport system ATP-binding protein